MNKNTIIMAGLLVATVNGLFGINMQDPKDVLYACQELGHDFASERLIVDNIDMLVDGLEWQIQLNEARLSQVQKKARKALLSGVVLYAGMVLSRPLVLRVMSRGLVGHGLVGHSLLKELIAHLSYVPSGLYSVYAGLDIWNAYAAKTELEESLALDREILAKLQAVRSSIEQ